MEGANNNKQAGSGDKEILFSQTIKAGTRIYYLDVKKNLKNDLFLAITESKKNHPKDGSPVTFEKHKIFIYQEDFTKFLNGMNEVIQYIRTQSPTSEEDMDTQENSSSTNNEELPTDIKLDIDF